MFATSGVLKCESSLGLGRRAAPGPQLGTASPNLGTSSPASLLLLTRQAGSPQLYPMLLLPPLLLRLLLLLLNGDRRQHKLLGALPLCYPTGAATTTPGF